MAGICSLAHIGERKKLCHSFGKAVDLLLAVCMLVQEVADMLFHFEPYIVLICYYVSVLKRNSICLCTILCIHNFDQLVDSLC